ncbi:MAG TPA: hypothetical protein VGN07_07860 [Steroidobacteraceae bacterium]
MKQVLWMVLGGALCSVSFASEYHLELGAGVKVCESYLENVKAVAVDPLRGRHACPIPVAKEVEGLSEPKWSGRYVGTPMPTPPYVDIDKQVDDYIWRRGVNPGAFQTEDEAREWVGTSAQVAGARRSFDANRERFYDAPSNEALYSEFDVDNDGVDEPVYHDGRNCHYLGFGSLLFVLKPDYSGIDLLKTDRLMVYPPRSVSAPLFFRQKSSSENLRLTSDAMRSARYGVFLFKDKSYITVWGFSPSGDPKQDATIHVFVLEKDRRAEVCSISISP